MRSSTTEKMGTIEISWNKFIYGGMSIFLQYAMNLRVLILGKRIVLKNKLEINCKVIECNIIHKVIFPNYWDHIVLCSLLQKRTEKNKRHKRKKMLEKIVAMKVSLVFIWFLRTVSVSWIGLNTFPS